ncbi:hypothetical protein N7512_001088 [Penicillium capsulatum]|nr:hypothetical protein N7512_001088 [Penicillium capsulatum]
MKTPMCVRIDSGNRKEPSRWIADVDGDKVSPADVVGFVVDGILSATSVLALGNSDAFSQTSSSIKGDQYCKPVVFTAMAMVGSQSGILTDVWYLYGSFVLLNVPGAAFYAQPTGKEGLYNLMWSTSKMASLNSIPITIKTTAPVTGSAQMITGA